MTIQTKITASAIRLTLFFFLSATSVWALAGSAIMANQVAPVVSVTVNASESVAGPGSTTHRPNAFGRRVWLCAVGGSTKLGDC